MPTVIHPRLYLIAKFRVYNIRSILERLSPGKRFNLDNLIGEEYSQIVSSYNKTSQTRRNEEWRFAKKWALTNKLITQRQGSALKDLPVNLNHLE
jgi:hypothetical protein